MTWIKTNERFVAFFDIMGFKNLVNSEKHENVLKVMEELSDFVKSVIDSKHFDEDDSMIKTSIFSDSILIVSNNNSINCAANLMTHSAFLIEKATEMGIPLKGSIAYGKFTADFEKSLFIGQPLIDAFLLQEELFVYSMVIHHTFETYLTGQEYGEEKFPNNIRWYRDITPFKNGKSKHYHLNWLFYTVDDIKMRDGFRTLVSDFYKSVSGKTRAYVDNSIDLFDKMAEQLDLT